jgi:hypothetical protein
MDKALENEIINEMYASMSPEKREELRIRASELVKNKDFLQAAELIRHSTSIEMDESKFAGELGWLAALSVAICSVAVLWIDKCTDVSGASLLSHPFRRVIVEKAVDKEIAREKYASITPEQREELKQRASELLKDSEFLRATELLKDTAPVKYDKAKFAGEMSWLAALAVAISAIALLWAQSIAPASVSIAKNVIAPGIPGKRTKYGI